MPQITPVPFTLKDVLLNIGADSYEKQVSSVEFVPTASVTTWKGLNPTAVFTDVSTATWVANLSFAQDWETPNSLSRVLYDSEGQTKAVSFKPKSGTGPTWNAVLVITPGSIGGAVDSTAVATVSLGVQGRPTIVNAGVTVPQIATTDVVTGPVAGGNVVFITGSGFTGTLATTGVRFGTSNATSFKVYSDTLIAAVAPAQAAGSKPIVVQNASGTSAVSPYTYA